MVQIDGAYEINLYLKIELFQSSYFFISCFFIILRLIEKMMIPIISAAAAPAMRAIPPQKKISPFVMSLRFMIIFLLCKKLLPVLYPYTDFHYSHPSLYSSSISSSRRCISSSLSPDTLTLSYRALAFS